MEQRARYWYLNSVFCVNMVSSQQPARELSPADLTDHPQGVPLILNFR
jgi:hypothetical protein